MSKKVLGATLIVGGIAFIVLNIIAKKKRPDSVFENDPKQKNPLEGKKVIFVEDENDIVNADGIKGHLEVIGVSNYKLSKYEKYTKRGIDLFFSFVGIVILSPIMGAIALAIKIEDPGPVLFTQKRIGENKKYFKLHKFRSMKICTPHDVPTHMMDNPEQYITKVGKFLRSHSLDELPQIWDIFLGNMSIIGPRPGLWNQDVLTAEREKYGVNDIKPGLTGWAQINGRDELEIPDKAKLDGEYCQNISLRMDTKVFLRSLYVFGGDASVIEGGTGEIKKVGRNFTKNKSKKELIGHIGFENFVEINSGVERRILITGAGSYIGECFRLYADEYYPNFKIETIDMIDSSWRDKDFSEYDIVYHVAGLAHADIGRVDDLTKLKYYEVNTDLAVEVCQKAKKEGVQEFIFMSSMIVYGDSAPYGKAKFIDEHTLPIPSNFYGDSKLQADIAVREFADDHFKVIVIRPPMVYGKGSKGNYPILTRLAKKLPLFPNVENKRSMIYIDNLCEFLCQIMMVKEINPNAVVLMPQNKEWTKTSEMVRSIADYYGKRISITKVLRPIVYVAGKCPGKVGCLVRKAFGNLAFDQNISVYPGIDYQRVSLKESIKKIGNSDKEEAH